MSKNFGTGFNPFDKKDDDGADVHESLFGQVDIPDSGRVIAQPIEIMSIRPDPVQPRRAIPASVRGSWDGDPRKALDVLETWRDAVQKRIGQPIDVRRGINADDRQEIDSTGDSFADDYLSLLSLASSIRREGLTNPITVVRRGAEWMIDTGERRWLAHHLLDFFADKKFAKIPARDVNADVWRQASENGSRKPLTAIGMARQLALLIMDMYDRDDGVMFDGYQQIIYPGDCDRKFYAQVANGQMYRVKRGFSQRVLDVTGLKSRAQIAHYRNLLSVPDDVWSTADEEGWTEGKIRAYMDELNNPEKYQESDVMFTAVNITPDRAIDDYGDVGGSFPDITEDWEDNGHVRVAVPVMPNSSVGSMPDVFGDEDDVPAPDMFEGDGMVAFADENMRKLIHHLADVCIVMARVLEADGAGELTQLMRRVRWWTAVTPDRLREVFGAEAHPQEALVNRANADWHDIAELITEMLGRFSSLQDTVIEAVGDA